MSVTSYTFNASQDMQVAVRFRRPGMLKVKNHILVVLGLFTSLRWGQNDCITPLQSTRVWATTLGPSLATTSRLCQSIK